jgi:hypothetical protein
MWQKENGTELSGSCDHMILSPLVQRLFRWSKLVLIFNDRVQLAQIIYILGDQQFIEKYAEQDLERTDSEILD